MSDILSARAAPAAPAPMLTAHLRHHLLAQYRADLRHDVAERDHLARAAAHDRRADKRRTHRIGRLQQRIEATLDAIAELDGGAA